MLKAEAVILNSMGLHARPASKLVKIASRAGCEVFLTRNGQKVNAKSILGVIMLEAEQGAKVIIEIPDDSEQEVLEQLVQLINDGFGEK